MAPMPADSAYAAPAPNAAAPNHAIQSADARLNTAMTAPMYATPKRVRTQQVAVRRFAGGRTDPPPRRRRRARSAHRTRNPTRAGRRARTRCRARRARRARARPRAPRASPRAPAGSGTRRGSRRRCRRRRSMRAACPSCVSRAMQKNETRNVSASMKNTSANGRWSISNGSAATAANSAAPIGMLPYDVPRISPLASGSSSSLATRSGIDASRAGRKTMLATSMRKPHRYTHHNARTSGTSAIITARASRPSRAWCADDPNAARPAPRAARRSPPAAAAG